ncbi:multidrug resistance-associated ABC transporter [Cristinia sonorae]|uniref:Multidrug resistance-associated ABC transporter n=1 Tax=Cristinia sonorae TaxID=1940300 RepID=A0A8K0ULR3_9AGAR|nr:multidrug resistance-associated ABC transporter [Cristinia sonorae]
MALPICERAPLSDFADRCVRDFWGAIIPSALAIFLTLLAVPAPKFLPAFIQNQVNIIKLYCTDFLTLPEAESLDAGEDPVALSERTPVPLWRSVFLSGFALVETLVWLGYGSYVVVAEPADIWTNVRPFVVAFAWFYAASRPITKPTATPPYDLFLLFLLHFVLGGFMLGGLVYDHRVLDVPYPPALFLVAHAANLVVVLLLVVIILNMPVGVPSKRVKIEEIGLATSPEDYTSLWGWTTFRWVQPLVTRGTSTTLNENNVWNLSPRFQSRPLFLKWSLPESQRATLLRKLWALNAHDLLIDFILTYVSVIFNYLGPFFLKRILDSLDPNVKQGEKGYEVAYVYAFLAFASQICKAQADLQHLWYGRRAATRIRSELMAAIYDKSLKRKDFSGIIDKDAAQKKDPKVVSAASKGDDPKAGADVGKIVNLMAGDANRISQTVCAIFMIYSAPFEIIVASLFLYQLLGISAFAGFVFLIIGWPLNNFISRRSIRIQKGVSAARDKRMGVLNELIGAVKFIKFFAWEERWIKRVLDARETEIQWFIKARINSVLFTMMWTLAPVFISVTAFFVYIMQGNELTVGTAFTSIALFSMIRAPLNILPAYIVQVLQTGVALNRIATYLDEDEVDEQVSTLKRSDTQSASSADIDSATYEGVTSGLGILDGTFKWNEVEEKKEENGKPANGTTAEETDTIVGSSSASVAEAQDHRFELRDINVLFPEGELTVVTGPTASGKTALLMALLGELTRLQGRIILSKRPQALDPLTGLKHAVSYAAQSPWLRHQSIRDNILFGYPYDEKRYKDVVECCALLPDLKILEDGDATEIGARGVSLSGGQKARVALARAIYAPTKYVLLDDPLSAVDSHTSRFLFERLFQGPLLKNRTVVLVTHHVELVLPGTHYLVRMLDGRIDTQGFVKDLRARGVLETITSDESVEVRKEEEQVAAEATPEETETATPVEGESGQEGVGVPAKAKKPRKLIEDEHREEGSVKWNIYRTYLKASSYWTWSILIVLIVSNQFLGVGEKFWIKFWGQAYGEQNGTGSAYISSFANPAHEISLNGEISTFQAHHPYYHSSSGPTFSHKFKYEWPRAQDHPFFYIGVYTAITLGAGFVNIGSVITQYTGALRASRVLFEKLLTAVVRATMRWHDVTPQGRMLNRFSKDVETIDTSLASTLQAVNSSLASFAASAFTIVVIFPLFIFPAIVIGFIYRHLALGYLNTGRDLRRMESNSRSPIFANFGEVLEGIVTVRAFSAERQFLDDLHAKVDATTKMWYSFWMTNRWLLLHFDALGATGVLITTLFALSGFVDAGLAGVCITSAMSFTTSVYWACRFWTGLELDLNSVERVVEYLDLPSEPPTIIESSRPPAYWPSSSGPNADSMISVEDLVIKYSPELPSVLHSISFTLKAKERIGLLGRTGSGKSTLAMSILRFVDPASGRIMIDGIDISKIGLHDLRSRITFIPQDAALFSGTLRENLDPFGEHEDSECLDVLYRVQLITEGQLTSQRTSREASRAASRAASIKGVEREESVAGSVSTSSPTATDTDRTIITLETQVSPGGTNFSQGQRQLIAMARALLRRSSIIVLDEATSSIDFATDAKIQATIREEFGESLLLTVAHRLRTVIDYDRLLVLDKGVLAEFDTPWNLLQKEDGIFRNMCLKSGQYAELEATAKAKAGL